MGDQSLRLAVEGISPPEKEKHQFFIDVQPVSIFLILDLLEIINGISEYFLDHGINSPCPC
jgi:hypothetical protein